MKVRSKPLYEYLLQHDVLNKSEVEVLKLKKQYRQEYRKQWARTNRTVGHEVRFRLSEDEYKQIQEFCKQNGEQSATHLAKKLLIHYSRSSTPIIPNKRVLNAVSQKLGLVINKYCRNNNYEEITQSLLAIENILMKYLTQYKTGNKL